MEQAKRALGTIAEETAEVDAILFVGLPDVYKRQGYDMIGVDNSEEMLEIAREAEYEADAWSAAEAWDEADETDALEEYAELGEPDEPEESDEPDEPDEPDELPNGGILYLLEDMRELEL